MDATTAASTTATATTAASTTPAKTAATTTARASTTATASATAATTIAASTAAAQAVSGNYDRMMNVYRMMNSNGNGDNGNVNGNNGNVSGARSSGDSMAGDPVDSIWRVVGGIWAEVATSAPKAECEMIENESRWRASTRPKWKKGSLTTEGETRSPAQEGEAKSNVATMMDLAETESSDDHRGEHGHTQCRFSFPPVPC
jgi:hypothetical protein